MEVEHISMILSDSTSATAIAANPVYHSKTKHFEIDIHFIKDKVIKEEIEINYVANRYQITDILTKPLSYCKFSDFRTNSRSLTRP